MLYAITKVLKKNNSLRFIKVVIENITLYAMTKLFIKKSNALRFTFRSNFAYLCSALQCRSEGGMFSPCQVWLRSGRRRAVWPSYRRGQLQVVDWHSCITTSQHSSHQPAKGCPLLARRVSQIIRTPPKKFPKASKQSGLIEQGPSLYISNFDQSTFPALSSFCLK
jgi:hypothetical protein